MPGDALHAAVPLTSRTSLVRASWIALGAAMFATLALRFVGLDHLPGVNGDETVYTVHALSFFDGAPLATLRTGTDLPMNPPFFGLVLLLQALLPPTLLTLRLAALVHSLLAIGLAYTSFRRRSVAFGATFALLVACLPIHVGYARFAWDTAAVPTMMVLSLAAATRRKPLWTALAFFAGLWVHPVTVFSLPVVLAPFAAHAWPRETTGSLRAPNRRIVLTAVLALVSLVAAAALLLQFRLLPARVLAVFDGPLIESVSKRVLQPLGLFEFLVLYAELLCGSTIYRYITASFAFSSAIAHLFAFAACTLPLVYIAVRKLKTERRWEDLALMLGLIASLLLAYLVGGRRMLAPSTERYGIFFAVPSCYLLAVCVEALSTDARRAAALRLAVSAVGLALSLSFAVNYLAELHEPSPRRENAFRTGDVDPKQLALAAVLHARDPKRTTVIFAQDWWIYWPVRYLAHREPNVRVTIFGQRWDYRFPRDYEPNGWGPNPELFAIAWSDGPFEHMLRPHTTERFTIRGYEPQPILEVLRVVMPTQRSVDPR